LEILDDVPIKVGDFYVAVYFMILDTFKDARTQIILGRPFLATIGCKINVEGRLTFDVGEKHAKFDLFKDFESAPSTYSCCGCDVTDLVKHKHLIDMTQNKPSSLNCALYEGQGFDNVKVKYLPPSVVKGKSYVVDEDYLSD